MGMIVCDVAEDAVTSRAIDWTAQVVKLMGTLIAVPTVANT